MIAAAGASIKEIIHDRAFSGPDLSAVRVVCVVDRLPAVMITAYNMSFTPRELAAVPSLKTVVRKPFKWTVLAEEVRFA